MRDFFFSELASSNGFFLFVFSAVAKAEHGIWTKNSQWHHVSQKGIPESTDYLKKKK